MSLPRSQDQHQSPADDLEFHRLLRRSAEPGVLVTDAAGRLMHCNEAAQALLQSADPNSPNTEGQELPACIRQCLSEARSSIGGTLERTISLEDPKGTGRRFLWLNLFRLADTDSLRDTFVATLHDLGVARELEAQTARLQRLANVGLLSAGVAHEVKNALVAVKTYAELLLEKQPDAESAVLVRREVGRIDSLVGQLLQLASPSQRAATTVALHDVLGHALRLVHHPLQERRIEEILLFNANADLVWGDSTQLQQAFLNLFFNAIEAMDGGGRLVVRTEIVVATEHISKFDPGRREQQLQVEVHDTGVGIPAELLHRLFTPFVTTKPSGTGLGLAITRRIVQEHRGRITVESQPGKGTVFRVILPLHRVA
jgi:signal transduction histidine kinase